MNDRMIESLLEKFNTNIQNQILICSRDLAFEYLKSNPESCDGLSINEIMLMNPIEDILKCKIVINTVRDYLTDFSVSFFIDMVENLIQDKELFLRLLRQEIEIQIKKAKEEIEVNDALIDDRSYQALRKTELRQDNFELNRNIQMLVKRLEEIQTLNEEETRESRTI